MTSNIQRSRSRDILGEICAKKRAHLARRRSIIPLEMLQEALHLRNPPRGFARHLQDAQEKGKVGLIAEVKKASPSKGLIRADFEPVRLSQAYQTGGATCLSVLTDRPYFQGRDEYLTQIHNAVCLPVLRKDFILDPYQVVESRALGADCILLIMACLDDAAAHNLENLAHEYGMDVLIEVHDQAELKRALKMSSPLIGINNRDLKTMIVSLEVTEMLAPQVDEGRLVISESGIHDPADLARMAEVGVHCFLVGESLMRQKDVTAATRALLARP